MYGYRPVRKPWREVRIMSKRVANTRATTARNGRIRYSWRRAANKAAFEDTLRKKRVASITNITKHVSCWQKVKNYIRRRCGKS